MFMKHSDDQQQTETPHDNDLPPCTNCGVQLWGPMLKMQPFHDGEGRYYIARCCPECGHPVGGIITSEKRPLADRFREKAVRDPAPERWDLEDVPTMEEFADA